MSKNASRIRSDRPDFRQSWYEKNASRAPLSLGVLKGAVNADICVIGGGFTGLSTAYELARAGFDVILLERHNIASGASGKNGGQLIRGFAKGPAHMISRYGLEAARLMNEMTLEGIDLIRQRIHEHAIDCDLKDGHVTAALHPKHTDDFAAEISAWQKLGQDGFRILSQNELQGFVRSDLYTGGMFDERSAHLNPLAYAYGLARAAIGAGVRVYTDTRVMAIEKTNPLKIVSEQGFVSARLCVIAGAIDVPGLAAINRTALDATAHMIATAPLSAETAAALMPAKVAVADANFIMNYFRLSKDNRILFGGNCNYSNREMPAEPARLRARMLEIFPQLADVDIEHCWHGPLNLTANRMPRMGVEDGRIFYAHGFGGQGIITTNLAGRLIAEAVRGTAERFDVFTRIGHLPFPGGDLLRRPLFVLGMTWYKLRDTLGLV